MNQIPIKLGPLALLLTMITICLTVLTMLTFATASADKTMAERYASSVKVRYEMNQQGQQFLKEADDALAEGVSLETLSGVTKHHGIYEKTIKDGGYTLTVGIREKNGRCKVESWTLNKKWADDKGQSNLWTGE